MIGNNVGIIEMAMTGVLVLGFCLYQYIAMTRDIARSKRERDTLAKGAGHPHGEHRLDDR
jgi:hypothetical protein